MLVSFVVNLRKSSLFIREKSLRTIYQSTGKVLVRMSWLGLQSRRRGPANLLKSRQTQTERPSALVPVISWLLL